MQTIINELMTIFEITDVNYFITAILVAIGLALIIKKKWGECMYQIIYNFFSGVNVLGGAMSFESTQILVRYLSIGLSLLFIFGFFYFGLKCINKIFKG